LDYQESEEKPEDVEKIPVLERSDISREIAPIYNEELKLAGTPVIFHEIDTNGIGYVDLLFDLSSVPEEKLPYVGILQAVLGIIDTENYEYGELFNEINVHTGGISSSLELYPDVANAKEKAFKATFELKAKALYPKLHVAFAMMQEILTKSKLVDEKRLKEILSMTKSRLQMRFLSAGHTTAALRAMSYTSPLSKFKDLTSGIGYYEVVKYIEEHFEEEKENLIAELKQLVKSLFRGDNMMLSYTASKEGLNGLEAEIASLKSALFVEPMGEANCIIHCEQRNEGFKTSSKVQYVARAGNFLDAGYEYHGAFQILRVIMGYEYLWQNVRVKGGAYGCMSQFSRLGEGYFVSYRDPNLEKTNEVYEGVVEYLKNFTVSDRDMTKYIIGTMSNLDRPMTPAMKGDRSMNLYMCHISPEMIKEERNQILDAEEGDIRALADTVKAVLDANLFCVIGSEDKIEEQKELFKEVRSIF
jgi:Zn-dependent M16 (insulinase) family peptidase